MDTTNEFRKNLCDAGPERPFRCLDSFKIGLYMDMDIDGCIPICVVGPIPEARTVGKIANEAW